MFFHIGSTLDHEDKSRWKAFIPQKVFYDCSVVMPSLILLPQKPQVNGIADLQPMVVLLVVLRLAQEFYIPSNDKSLIHSLVLSFTCI